MFNPYNSATCIILQCAYHHNMTISLYEGVCTLLRLDELFKNWMLS